VRPVECRGSGRKLKQRPLAVWRIPSPVSIEPRYEPRYRLAREIIPAVRFECHLAVTVSAPVIRFGVNQGAQGGKPVSRVPTLRSPPQMRLTENSYMEQRLAMKIRPRLRVICATPVQKRSV
jgi:hypothetical protein